MDESLIDQEKKYAEYWRKKYERMRRSLEDILSLSRDQEAPFEDIASDTEHIAYKALYHQSDD